MFKNLKKNNKKGFTLIEILVVIALVGVLAAIAVPRFTNVQSGVKEKADIASLNMWASELDAQYSLGNLTAGANGCGAATNNVFSVLANTVATAPTMSNTISVVTADVNSSTHSLSITYDPDGAGTRAAQTITKTLSKVN